MARKLYNPTDRNLGYWWNGERYEVPAGKEVQVADDHLAYHLLRHQPDLADTINAPVAGKVTKKATKTPEKTASKPKKEAAKTEAKTPEKAASEPKKKGGKK
jgi:hypothetical protein